MGNFVASVRLDPIKFDGDSITFTVKPLKQKHMIALSPYIDKNKGTVGFESLMQMYQVVGQIVPDCLEHIEGMTLAGGATVDAAKFLTLTEENYFAPLLGELLTSLISVSTVKKAEAKNLQPQPPDSSEACGETNLEPLVE